MPEKQFTDLGVCREITDVIEKLGWSTPSAIQIKAIPPALRGKDVVGFAETGSGKTAAFAVPILQDLLVHPKHNFALVLTPTRELAVQTRSQFLELGTDFGLKVICLVGGQHVEDQLKDLKRSKYHIIIGTPGRIVFHLENSKELRLSRIRYLVFDEVDQLLTEAFQTQLAYILSRIPKDRRTYMYSATNSDQIQKIQSLCVHQPIIVEVDPEHPKVDRLDHAFVFLPIQERDNYLMYVLGNSDLKAVSQHRTIVFTATWRESFRVAALLKAALFSSSPGNVVALNGAMQQTKRQDALFSFRSGEATVMVATDIAARGLDIPDVNLVLNYDVPSRPSWSESAKAYIHRVGRTARAGRSGRAITLVTPYSATRLKVIEAALGERVPQLPWPGANCLDSHMRDVVADADRRARATLRNKDKHKRMLQKKENSDRRGPPTKKAKPTAQDNDSSDSD